MHKGRTYPYHPVYWVTEGWFWPGYCPWKVTLDVFNNGNPPWNIYTSGYGEVSQPGFISTNRLFVRYDFTYHAPAFGLQLFLDSPVISGVKQCRWLMRLVSGVVTWAEAVRLKPIPQRSVFNNLWPLVYPAMPYTATASPPYQFTATNYSLGGSPWPPLPPLPHTT